MKKFNERLPEWVEGFSPWGVCAILTEKWRKAFRMVLKATCGNDPVMTATNKILKMKGIYEALTYFYAEDPITAKYIDRIAIDFLAEYPPRGKKAEFYRTLELADILEAE